MEIYYHGKIVEGKEFEISEEGGVETALRNCLRSGYRPLFMPELIDARIKNIGGWFELWRKSYLTPSLVVAGRDKEAGEDVVLYAHIPNFLADFKNLVREITLETSVSSGGTIDALPQEEFERLVSLVDGKKVFKVKFNFVPSLLSGEISLREALKHPRVIPFLGGRKRAGEYLEKLSIYKILDVKPGPANNPHLCEPTGSLLSIGSFAGYKHDGPYTYHNPEPRNTLDDLTGWGHGYRFLAAPVLKRYLLH